MSGIVGREVEQRHLLDLLRTVRSGDGHALVLSGPPGIGKSTLADWLCRQADGFTVLRAHGHEADRNLGFLVLRQLLRPFSGVIGGLDAHLAEALQAAMRLSGGAINDGLVPLAVLELLSRASDDSPVLVVVDDAHLCDPASLSTLAFVARRLASERVLMVFGVRAGELEEPDLFVPIEELSIADLDHPASQMLVEAAGNTFDDSTFARCGGNPLALQHLTTAAGSNGAVAERLIEDFRRTIRRAPVATQRALELVALGGSISPDVRDAALAALGVSSDDLRVAVGTGIIDQASEFAHPLLRAAATPADADAAAIHDALAAAHPADRRDRQVLHTLLGTGPYSLDLIAEAGEIAESLAADNRRDDAYALFAAAGERHPDPESRSNLWRRAGHMVAFGGRFNSSVPIFERALREASSPTSRVQVMRTMAWAQMWDGAQASVTAARLRTELLAASVESVPAVELSRAWGSLLGLCVIFDIHVALAALAEMPHEVDAAGDEVMVLCLGNAAAGVEARRTMAEQMVHPLVGADAVYEPSAAAHGELLLIEGCWASADEWNRAAVDAFRAVHLTSELGPATSRWVFSRLFLGDATTAYGLALASIERTPTDGTVLGTAAMVGAVTGAERAAQWATKCLEIGRQLGITAFSIDGLHRLGLIELAADRPERAAAHLTEAWELMTTHGFRHPGYSFARGDVAESLIRTGRADDARRVIAELVAGPFELSWARGVAARARGLLGDESGFSDALKLLAASPWEVARTRLCWARAVAGRDDDLCTRQAAEAAKAFELMGAWPWAEQARKLISAGAAPGASPPAAASDPLDALSERERTVALTVSRGLSNKEVAGELFISLKTVDAHLQQIYRKLEIRSRTQLAAVCLGRTASA